MHINVYSGSSWWCLLFTIPFRMVVIFLPFFYDEGIKQPWLVNLRDVHTPFTWIVQAMNVGTNPLTFPPPIAISRAQPTSP